MTRAAITLSLFAAFYAHAQQIGGCQVFPSNNVWNTVVDRLPRDARSDAYIASIGIDDALHPDFVIPFVVVPASQAKVPIHLNAYADESDPGPYPVPANAPIEGGASATGDRHVLVIQQGGCRLFELFRAFPQKDGSWNADAGAIFDLGSNSLRTAGWTSADAAGLPILPGLVRYEEVAAGDIRHALRFTAPRTRAAYVWPARHRASQLTGAEYPPMGQRFRLKASVNETQFSPQSRVIIGALKRYGMFLADNGKAWYLSGAPDERWDNRQLADLNRLRGSDFEAVDESMLMADPNSAAVGRRAVSPPRRARDRH